MDREVIAQKLESLRHCLQRVETRCPADAQTLATDADLQDIVALNLSRAVQVCAWTLAPTSFRAWRYRRQTRWGRHSTCSHRLAY